MQKKSIANYELLENFFLTCRNAGKHADMIDSLIISDKDMNLLVNLNNNQAIEAEKASAASAGKADKNIEKNASKGK